MSYLKLICLLILLCGPFARSKTYEACKATADDDQHHLPEEAASSANNAYSYIKTPSDGAIVSSPFVVHFTIAWDSYPAHYIQVSKV